MNTQQIPGSPKKTLRLYKNRKFYQPNLKVIQKPAISLRSSPEMEWRRPLYAFLVEKGVHEAHRNVVNLRTHPFLKKS